MPVATIDRMIADYAKGVTDFTVDGKCSGCGSCCTNFLPMTGREIKRIRDYIRRAGIKECKHYVPAASAVIDMTCPFRNNMMRRCEIYKVRPAICRSFQCGGKRAAAGQRNSGAYVVDVRQTFFQK